MSEFSTPERPRSLVEQKLHNEKPEDWAVVAYVTSDDLLERAPNGTNKYQYYDQKYGSAKWGLMRSKFEDGRVSEVSFDVIADVEEELKKLAGQGEQ